MELTSIFLKGIRVNNLKGFNLSIPRDKFIVITGVSGSGKSSLAFDTLYAEGQRRYVESLSAYARQFVGRIKKPEVDTIHGIPPAIAIEQRVNSRNPRSTVGTSTEVYDYLRLLFARIGTTLSPISGTPVTKHTPADLLRLLEGYPSGTTALLCAPLDPSSSSDDALRTFSLRGFSRILLDDQLCRIEELLELPELPTHTDAALVIDRLTTAADDEWQRRLWDSAEAAFAEGNGTCLLRIQTDEGIHKHLFSKHFEADGRTFEEPSDSMFNFNSGLGACPHCQGLGIVNGIDRQLVIPDTNLSLYQGAVAPWRGDAGSEWKKRFILLSEEFDFPIHRPYCDLSDPQRNLLWEGQGPLQGILHFFEWIDTHRQSLTNRTISAHYRGKTTCPHCHGTRLKEEALWVKVNGHDISQLVALPLQQLREFFRQLPLNPQQELIARRILLEINNRLTFLVDVGLGYLTLNRLSSSLSGGESQRINLATALGSNLVGSLYVLDEPSVGLHPRDTARLISVLRRLQQAGNTVVVVEHDEDLIRAADYIIDIGTHAGDRGGYLVGMFDPQLNLLQGDGLPSHTLDYLQGRQQIPIPARRPWHHSIQILGARKNNLKSIDVTFPLHVITVVSGVSGSGKTSLVHDVLYQAIKLWKDDAPLNGIEAKSLAGDYHLIAGIEFIGQQASGKSTRSNPVTYIGAYDEIRKLFAAQPLSQQMGYTHTAFSFNAEGGRCETCKGEGRIVVEMQFMADIEMVCDDCHGKRFCSEILQILYHGFNIHQILLMTVDQAIDFFSKHHDAKKIVRALTPLQHVGLGYITLGQASSSLSGGENQRLKLAAHLHREHVDGILFIFDEPTTGLHFHDIKTLLHAFNTLVEHGASVIIIEHNLEIIKAADYLIDLGPEGGHEGGYLLAAGTPEQVAALDSPTATHLRASLLRK
jgi:excinuclease ABC subunit A